MILAVWYYSLHLSHSKGIQFMKTYLDKQFKHKMLKLDFKNSVLSLGICEILFAYIWVTMETKLY